MLFISKTVLQNCLLLLIWPILAILALGAIQIFQISSKKSFITSTPVRELSIFYAVRRKEPLPTLSLVAEFEPRVLFVYLLAQISQKPQCHYHAQNVLRKPHFCNRSLENASLNGPTITSFFFIRLLFYNFYE